MVVAGSGFTVLMAVLFNLISDLIGGGADDCGGRRNRQAPAEAHTTPQSNLGGCPLCRKADTTTGWRGA